MSKQIPIDSYVLDTLMRDLTSHDKSPATFLVYLYLYSATVSVARKAKHRSLQMIAEETGLSKSAVQQALRRLARRRLIATRRASKTAVPEYAVLRPWNRA
jgi:DNA-binding GntR family transcriptional regulator